jgi:hypothetical protein
MFGCYIYGPRYFDPSGNYPLWQIYPWAAR